MLPDDMGAYMRKGYHLVVQLHGPNRVTQDCDLEFDTSYPWDVKICSGWRRFATMCNFKAGDELKMIFCNYHVNNVVLVKKM